MATLKIICPPSVSWGKGWSNWSMGQTWVTGESLLEPAQVGILREESQQNTGVGGALKKEL